MTVRPQLDSADQEYLQGVKCRSANQLPEAIKHYERAIALRPNHARGHNNIGVIQQERRFHVGREAYQQAIESDPQFGLAWFNRGNCLREANRLSEAIADYRRAFALMPPTQRRGSIWRPSCESCDTSTSRWLCSTRFR